MLIINTASAVLFTLFIPYFASAVTHPGLLHSNEDFERIKGYISSGAEPQLSGWKKLEKRANKDYQPAAAETVCRGASWCNPQNYPVLFRDAHSAYVNSVYWKLTGDAAFGDAAARTLDAWASELKVITGSSDKFLVAGLQGYQMANAAEVLRDYSGWKGLEATITMMQDVFLPMNEDFVRNHNGKSVEHYWANWGLANLCSMHAIGVLTDNDTAIQMAYDTFKQGPGMEALPNAIWEIHTEEGSGKELGQGQESGRDQGHSILNFALLGTLAQQAWNQGEDLFGLMNNRILAGSEYVSKYNVGEDVPYTPYRGATVIGADGRGGNRPIAELLIGHYEGVKGLNASWTQRYREQVLAAGGGAEGGGGDYGPNSGGYDQLGFGTILYRRS
ncbi:Alginate lyase [Ceratocystis lukuohia]|uniref:Alginate lyase n=2 Tax=Ceratocystis TaxID=5157 RepID=A0A0F8B1G9_CERFI|nr:Alginate lyase [Ceratocystis platani]